MASSSDWIAAAQAEAEPSEGPEAAGPNWIKAIGASAGFVEQLPLAGAATRHSDQGPHSAPQPDAMEQAFAEGEAAGRAAAAAEAVLSADHQRKLRLAFRTLDQAALDALASELSDTVLALCEQVMEPHAIDRNALAQRCKEAARRIGNVASEYTLHLHPDDIATLGDEFCREWQAEPDPALERGNIRLEGADGAVRDGPREWRRAIAAALAA